ncbi:cupin domain-containing protein [Sphingomonas aracearum]|uniref:Cupin domain-containing protein n=2 Tax=Sphingomonas aracearum TaxID=2283317 RepID=A0A369VYY6_9SPHN|nr:cupin domain-containing protein [Sphingomonas aracearum]
MTARVARFKDLVPYSKQYTNAGIPIEAFERLTARSVYSIMAPQDYKGRSAMAPIKSLPGAVVSIAECPPGDSPGLHCHEMTVENFFCLNGRFEILWGDHGEHSLVLEPLDFISVPAGVTRSFTNISDEVARLLVIIQPPVDRSEDRVAYAPDFAKDLEADFGGEVVDQLKAIGFKFNAGEPEDEAEHA